MKNDMTMAITVPDDTAVNEDQPKEAGQVEQGTPTAVTSSGKAGSCTAIRGMVCSVASPRRTKADCVPSTDRRLPLRRARHGAQDVTVMETSYRGRSRTWPLLECSQRRTPVVGGRAVSPRGNDAGWHCTTRHRRPMSGASGGSKSRLPVGVFRGNARSAATPQGGYRSHRQRASMRLA